MTDTDTMERRPQQWINSGNPCIVCGCETWVCADEANAAIRHLKRERDTMERLWHKRLDSYHLKACRWWGEGVCDCNLASLIREIAHLEREREEYRETNESVSVCRDHTNEIVTAERCVVCERDERLTVEQLNNVIWDYTERLITWMWDAPNQGKLRWPSKDVTEHIRKRTLTDHGIEPEQEGER